MKHSFQTRDIALNLLVLRPQNVPAEYGSGYSTEQMAPLAANIAECVRRHIKWDIRLV